MHLINRWALVRAVITGLSFLSVTAALSAVPAQAYYTWYLFYSPVMIAALSFGLFGAVAASAWAALSLSLTFGRTADPNAIAGVVRIDPLVLPREAEAFFSGLSNHAFVRGPDGAVISAATVDGLLGNALLGMVLTTAISCVIGWLVDENRRQMRLFQRLARTDGLTGVANYRYLMERLGEEVARAVRLDRTCGYLMIDLDGPKGYNDRYGHAAGDAVLREVAQLIQNGVREIDTIGRYGGDEFGVVLAAAGPEEALGTARRLRQVIAERFGPSGGDARGVTVSIGAAVCPLHGNSSGDLVRAADGALYQTKLTGKDNATLAPLPEAG